MEEVKLNQREQNNSGQYRGGGIGIGGYAGSIITNIVIFNNSIHDGGVWDPYIAVGDQDNHGIGIGNDVSYVWILDNHLYHRSGDGVQINSLPSAFAHHIYVGRNIAHDNKQTGFWSKYAKDVIFSENIAYNFRSSSSGSGSAMGFQYGPERVWFLFNTIYNSEFGFATGSASGPGFDGDGIYSYFIGNKLYNIHHNQSVWDPVGTPDCIAGSAFYMRGGRVRNIIGNTIYDVDAGVSTISGTENIILDNLISNISGISYSHHIRLDRAPITNVDNNLMDGNVCIITSMDYTACRDIQNFNANYGKCTNCINADPEFTDKASNDFSLKSTSPAIDSGIESEVYQTFYDLYGIDIRKDIEKKARPVDGDGNGSAEWDIGAYEYPSSGELGTQSFPTQSSSIFSQIWNWLKGILTGNSIKI